jgi:hypothetical protein
VRGREREAVGRTVDVGFDDGIVAGAFEVPFGPDDGAGARRDLDVGIEGDRLTRRDVRPARTVRSQVDDGLDALAGLRRRRHFDLAVDEFEVGAGWRHDIVLDPVRQITQRLLEHAEVADHPRLARGCGVGERHTGHGLGAERRRRAA